VTLSRQIAFCGGWIHCDDGYGTSSVTHTCWARKDLKTILLMLRMNWALTN